MVRRPPRSTLFPSPTLFRSGGRGQGRGHHAPAGVVQHEGHAARADRKSTRLNSSHSQISYAVFRLKKKVAFANSNGFTAGDRGCPVVRSVAHAWGSWPHDAAPRVPPLERRVPSHQSFFFYKRRAPQEPPPFPPPRP